MANLYSRRLILSGVRRSLKGLCVTTLRPYFLPPNRGWYLRSEGPVKGKKSGHRSYDAVGQKETGENEGDVLRKGEAHASEDQKTEGAT